MFFFGLIKFVKWLEPIYVKYIFKRIIPVLGGGNCQLQFIKGLIHRHIKMLASVNELSQLDPNDSLAIPTNAWWRTELFDLTNEASYAQVRFKFVIKRGNGSATHFAYGWLIDDF